MILHVYSLYDSKVGNYHAPVLLKNKGEAIRGFTEIINDPKTNVHKYPQDFTLFELGTFDDSNAKFTLYSTPRSVGTALEFYSEKVNHNVVGFDTPVVAAV